MIANPIDETVDASLKQARAHVASVFKLKLAVEHGRVTHLPEKDRTATDYDSLKRL